MFAAGLPALRQATLLPAFSVAPSALVHLLARGAWSRGEDCCINEQAHEASVPCLNMSFRRMSRGFSLCSAANSDCEKTVFAAVQPGSLHLGDFFANHCLVDRRLPEFSLEKDTAFRVARDRVSSVETESVASELTFNLLTP